MKFIKKQPFVIVNVSASTEAFFGTFCLITVHRSVSGQTGCRRCGRVDMTQPCHRLGSGQSHRQRKQQSGQMDQGGDTYQEGTIQVDEQRRGVLSTPPHLRQPVRPETERRTAIRQTVLKKASVKAKTSTITKKVAVNKFHFEK